MNHEQIKAALQEAELTLSNIAEAAGCGLANVSGVSRRKVTSKRIALAISAALQKEVSEVFPDIPSYSEPSGLTKEQRVALAKKRMQEAGLIDLAS